MKIGYALLLATLAFPVKAQRIQSGGATTQLNWRPTAATDSLVVDVDGDAAPDVVFTSVNTSPTGQGLPSFFRFTASIKRNSSTEIAIDANEYDSVHRFVAGDVIGPGLLWQRGGGYLASTVTGNGGTGGRGFFRTNDGFVAIRKQTSNQLIYWWFYIGSRAAGTDWVGYYAGTSVALASYAAIGSPAVLAFPNPATNMVALSRLATYELFDSRGALVRTSARKPVAEIALETLPAGLYLLQTHSDNGEIIRQKIVKQ